MVLIGTEQNKILGCSFFEDRSGVKDLTISGTSKCTPDRVSQDNETDYLLLNLASTPSLGVYDFRLCLYFFHFVINDDSRTQIDNIYSLTSKDIKIRTIGKDYSVYVYDVDTDTTEKYKMPFISLSNRLRKANVDIPLHTLRKTLQNLHNLGFVTITEINSNSAEFGVDEPVSTDCLLVKVNYFMMLTRQTQRWIKNK